MHSLSRAWSALSAVADPEIPSVSIVDLGIVRSVDVHDDSVIAQLTPTWSGCPAVSVIELEAEAALLRAGFLGVLVQRVLSPPWTTDWITPRGRDALREAGISSPMAGGHAGCPRCGSLQTVVVSEFGSTACKALWCCQDCREPFDTFKPV